MQSLGGSGADGIVLAFKLRQKLAEKRAAYGNVVFQFLVIKERSTAIAHLEIIDPDILRRYLICSYIRGNGNVSEQAHAEQGIVSVAVFSCGAADFCDDLLSGDGAGNIDIELCRIFSP